MNLLSRFETGLERFIQRRGLSTDEENQLFLLLFFTEVFGGGIHFLLIFGYLFVDILAFAGINLISACWYAGCCFLTYKRKYAASAMLATLEVLVYVLITDLCYGIRNGVILFLVLVMEIQLIIPYTKKTISRIRVGMMIIVVNVIVVIIDLFHTPYFHMDKTHETILLAFCFEVVFVGTIVLLSIGNYINGFILKYNKKLQEEFKTEATIDPLTGLGNRRAAADQEQEFYQSDDRWMVAMLDIDDFKSVNDTYGHQTGDLVLKQVANLIRTGIRQTDAAFRWGGEEFLICVRNVSEDEAFWVLEKIRKSIEAAVVKTDKEDIQVTVTMGVAHLVRKNPEHCLELSDKRLYRGKREGKNRVIMPGVGDE